MGWGKPTAILVAVPEDVAHLARLKKIADVADLPLGCQPRVNGDVLAQQKSQVQISAGGEPPIRKQDIVAAPVVQALKQETRRALAPGLKIYEQLVDPKQCPQIHLPPHPALAPAALGPPRGEDIAEGVHVAVEHVLRLARQQAVLKAPASLQGPQADVVSFGEDLHFGQRCIAALFIGRDADQPHYLEVLLGIQINASVRVERPRGIQRTAQQRNRNASLDVGLGRLENFAIAEHVVLSLDSGTLSDKDAKLPQGPGTLLVGERQLDRPRQYRPSQVDIDRPINELVRYLGLPIGRWIAINELGRVRLIATSTPISPLGPRRASGRDE